MLMTSWFSMSLYHSYVMIVCQARPVFFFWEATTALILRWLGSNSFMTPDIKSCRISPKIPGGNVNVLMGLAWKVPLEASRRAVKLSFVVLPDPLAISHDIAFINDSQGTSKHVWAGFGLRASTRESDSRIFCWKHGTKQTWRSSHFLRRTRLGAVGHPELQISVPFAVPIWIFYGSWTFG